MVPVAIAQPQMTARAQQITDEDVAGRSNARLLITASTPGRAEALARRIHSVSERAMFPLVHAYAIDLPGEPRMLREACSRLLAEAAGGTLLISDVEEMAPLVQERLVELLEELEFERASSAAVRLVSCTTAPLLDRIAAGAFSESLFYRLNLIHLRV